MGRQKAKSKYKNQNRIQTDKGRLEKLTKENRVSLYNTNKRTKESDRASEQEKEKKTKPKCKKKAQREILRQAHSHPKRHMSFAREEPPPTHTRAKHVR